MQPSASEIVSASQNGPTFVEMDISLQEGSFACTSETFTLILLPHHYRRFQARVGRVRELLLAPFFSAVMLNNVATICWRICCSSRCGRVCSDSDGGAHMGAHGLGSLGSENSRVAFRIERRGEGMGSS